MTVLTTKASEGDVVIEVTDPDRYQIGKYIVISGIDEDQYRTEDDGEIYLHNPLQSHSHNAGHGNSTNSHWDMEIPPTPIPTNEGQGNFTNSHGQNGMEETGLIELDGQGGAFLGEWRSQ